jgi:hypothetical protein
MEISEEINPGSDDAHNSKSNPKKKASPQIIPQAQSEIPASGSGKIFLRKEKIAPAFWTATGILSLIVNLILLVVVIELGAQIFLLKQVVTEQLIGGLYWNFVEMDQASIKTTIPVSAEVPAQFDLPLVTDTVVILNQDTYLAGASVKLSTGGLVIDNAPADIVLPAGTELPIHLDLMVPVDQMIPVELNVEVDIPLEQTDLHAPFVGLQNVVAPYYVMLWKLPNSWEQMMCAKKNSLICNLFMP